MSLSPTSGSSTPIDTWRDPGLDPARSLAPADRAATGPQVDMSTGYPRGDGSFADSVRGTAPQPEGDLQFALMANDVYADPATGGLTGTASETELAAAGLHRLQPADGNADHLVDPAGNVIPISPSLLHDPASGFDAAIYQNAQGQYVIAYRGTDSWFGENGRASDTPTNLGQAIGLETAAYSRATELAQRALEVFGEGNVAATGQSLGGGHASAAMLATGMPGVTFNASGLSNETLRALDLNPNAARADASESGQIRRYVVNGEVLTMLQQDLPAGVLVGSPPDAVGHELRIAPPADANPFNPIGLHGGGGDGAPYVEALRENTAYRPLDLSGTDAGLALGTVQNAAELQFNTIATGVRQVLGAADAVQTTVSETGQSIREVVDGDIADGRYIQGGVRIAGDVVDGVFDGAGRLVANSADHLGDNVENIATFGGSVLRDVGDRVGLDAPFDAVAGAIENGGHALNRGVDAVGDGAGRLVGTAGDVAEWTLDRVGEGAQWTGERIADGARATADAAVWTGERVVEGAQWTGERIVDGANAVADGARWVADRANPLNWFR